MGARKFRSTKFQEKIRQRPISYLSWQAPIQSLQDLTVLSTEFFRRRKTHIPSVINLPTESPIEMLRW